jgi:hypothetical protein
MRRTIPTVTSLVLFVIASIGVGCETSRGTGAAGGAGIGALIGAATGGRPRDVIRGAGIGAAGGYIIGNESNHARVAQQQGNTPPSELEPLAGTRWTLDSINPSSADNPQSMTIDFRRDGVLFSKRTDKNGRVTTDEEHFRIVDKTLIVNDRDYIINGSFILQRNSLTFVVGDTTSRWSRG